MAIQVQGGRHDGMLIRKARKATWCNNQRHCCKTGAEIQPGEHYTEMEVDPDVAGGFGMKKLCMACAGEEARTSLAHALGDSLYPARA